MHSVVVVDDDSTSCQALARLLTRLGDKATCLTSGQAALDYLRTHIPRLVILDIMMPGMDGFEVLSRIREDARLKDLPVVMFSAMGDPAAIDKAMNKGATDYWVKTVIDYSRLQELVAPYVAETV